MAIATERKAGTGLRWWHVLLLAVPATGVVWYLDRTGTVGGLTTAVFVLAAVGLIPLATMIGGATERLTEYVGEVAGGLLNATFSNVPELAIGVFLLLHARLNGNADVVASDHKVLYGLLIGSVINNVLLVLGVSVFAAALRHGRLTFSKDAAGSYSSMLALAVVGLSLPTLANAFVSDTVREGMAIENVSLLVGLVLVISYVAYIGSTVFHWRDKPDAAEEAQRRARATTRGDSRGFFGAFGAFAILTILTVLIAFVLVDSTDRVITQTPLTPLSVGLIVFPILCNVGEMAGVISGAFRKDMELAMSVAGSSAVQVPLLVTPLIVLTGFLLAGGSHDLLFPLIFQPLELIIVGLVTFVYALVSLDGEVTWLEGLQLTAFYAMIAVTALALPGR